MTERVTIHYRRPPDRLQIFEQAVLERTPECIVTLVETTPLKRPVCAAGQTILEPGAPVVWFTFPGAWHDIGRFHLRDRTFTGYYANVLTPVAIEAAGVWDTTDLFLDVWLGADGRVEVLDENELEEALQKGWVDDATAARATAEAETLAVAARAGRWPPRAVKTWTLERALEVLHPHGPHHSDRHPGSDRHPRERGDPAP